MALKAYKHLTDGEVKIVASDSAEETSLLADTVQGSSYLEMTSTGHSQEITAAQGTALWVDVTSDLGSGGGGLPAGMDYEVFEVSDLDVPSGTDWTAPHVFDSVEVPLGTTGLVSGLLVLSDPPAVSDELQLALWDPITDTAVMALTAFFPVALSAPYKWIVGGDIVLAPTVTGSMTEDPPPASATMQAALLTPNGVTTEDIHVVQGRITLLTI